MAYRSSEDPDVIVEFIPVGRFVRVSAVCARTGDEVTIVGDPNQSQDVLSKLAVRKLRYRQAKLNQT